MEKENRRVERPADRRRSAGAAKPTRGARAERQGKRGGAAQEAAIDFGRRRLFLLLGAVGMIIAGFIALAMGSTVAAPILLVVGYLAAVPYALMASRVHAGPPSSAGQDPGPREEAKGANSSVG